MKKLVLNKETLHAGLEQVVGGTLVHTAVGCPGTLPLPGSALCGGLTHVPACTPTYFCTYKCWSLPGASCGVC
jgi:hypothetical protein